MVGKQESSTRALRSHKSWVQRLDTAIANITAEKSLEVWLQTDLESTQSLYHYLLNGDFRSLQVDLGEVKTITAFATQGNTVRQRDARLREYYIQYGDTGTDWLNYTYEGQRKARCSTMCWSMHIECFHSRSQHLYKFIGKKRKRLHKKRVQFPEDWFGTPTWSPWRHVKTLYIICRSCALDSSLYFAFTAMW